MVGDGEVELCVRLGWVVAALSIVMTRYPSLMVTCTILDHLSRRIITASQ